MKIKNRVLKELMKKGTVTFKIDRKVSKQFNFQKYNKKISGYEDGKLNYNTAKALDKIYNKYKKEYRNLIKDSVNLQDNAVLKQYYSKRLNTAKNDSFKDFFRDYIEDMSTKNIVKEFDKYMQNKINTQKLTNAELSGMSDVDIWRLKSNIQKDTIKSYLSDYMTKDDIKMMKKDLVRKGVKYGNIDSLDFTYDTKLKGYKATLSNGEHLLLAYTNVDNSAQESVLKHSIF